MGTMISETSGESRLLIIKYMKVMTIPKPSAVSMESFLGMLQVGGDSMPLSRIRRTYCGVALG
ncbi:hypothetical protein XFLM_06675 [Xylella fastidiosa subsp. fastidiosa GB514]|nr:hypothetical protein XFLM_06675 [Xylella fastidiosa subsp. fastidiosa GB514]